MRAPFLTLLLSAAFSLMAAPAPAAVTVEMGASRQNVSIADAFEVQVVIQNAGEDVEPPELAGDGFLVLSRQPYSSTQVINGRRSSALIIKYVLRATRAGTLRIPPVKIRSGNQVVQAPRGLSIEVEGIARQDDFILEVSSSSPNIFLQQEFTVVLKVFARRLGGEFAGIDPFATQGDTWPRLAIPWIEAVEGFDADPPQQYLESLQPTAKQGPGFPINNYGTQRFFDNIPFRFTLPRSEARRKTSDGSEADYFVYTLQKKFRAARMGAFEIPPVIARGTIFVARRPADRSGKPEARDFVAMSDPLQITVKDVPLEGRPPTYTGAIGQFKVTAAVTPDKVWVGVPMTLTLKVAGEGKLDAIGPLSLKSQKAFAEDFRIPEEPETGVVDPKTRTKTFVYGIRAARAGITAVPPIEFSYFDPKSEKYATVSTEPLPVTVEAGNMVASADVVSAAPHPAPRLNRQAERALYPNYNRPDALIAQAPSGRIGWAQFTLLASPPAIYLVCLLLVIRRRRLTADPRILRARGASRKAAASLSEARAALRGARLDEVLPALHRAATRLIADRLDLPAAGLTAREALEALARNEVAPAIRQSLESILTRCEQERYGMASLDAAVLQKTIDQTEALLQELEPCLR